MKFLKTKLLFFELIAKQKKKYQESEIREVGQLQW